LVALRKDHNLTRLSPAEIGESTYHFWRRAPSSNQQASPVVRENKECNEGS
jgi:hypothetical protein